MVGAADVLVLDPRLGRGGLVGAHPIETVLQDPFDMPVRPSAHGERSAARGLQSFVAVADKRVFRGTLSALWFLLNAVLIATYARNGHLDAASLRRSATLAPGLALGLVFGEIAHGRIPEKAFRAVVFAMLSAVGLVLAIRG